MHDTKTTFHTLEAESRFDNLTEQPSFRIAWGNFTLFGGGHIRDRLRSRSFPLPFFFYFLFLSLLFFSFLFFFLFFSPFFSLSSLLLYSILFYSIYSILQWISFLHFGKPRVIDEKHFWKQRKSLSSGRKIILNTLEANKVFGYPQMSEAGTGPDG